MEAFSRHSIKTRLIQRFSVLFLLLFIVVQGIALYNFREMSIRASRNRAETVAGIVRDSITSFMVLGVIQQRELFLRNIRQTRGLKDLRILRGKPVIAQFGEPRDIERATRDLELQVLETGEMRERLVETLSDVDYELIIPFRASRGGKINCMQCHHVEEGEVLGAVSITMNLTEERSTLVSTLLIMSLASLAFFVGTLYVIVAFFKPYTDFFSRLQKVFGRVEEGDFSQRVDSPSTDEAGDVARSLNNMMDRLSRTLSGIRVKVAHLIGHPLFTSGNAVQDTAHMVDELVRIYNFKRTIEKDTNVLEIYRRIERVLRDMKVSYYSIYTLEKGTNRIRPVISAFPEDMENPFSAKTLHSDTEGWCIRESSGKITECRACRTGTIVDSADFPDVCPTFQNASNGAGEFFHYCIPFFIGGQVGGVIQIAHQDPEKKVIQSDINYLKSYLQEAAPVIEAKTYMELLKEQSMIDRLTGMYNRRYLDEHMGELDRDDGHSTIGILMIDIDNFKSVNDEYGHDVGDLVLERMSQVIRENVRQTDVLVRFGGEEILVLLMDARPGNIVPIAEKIRRSVENTEFQTGSTRLRRTVSIGVGEFPGQSREFQKAIKLADMALYHAKETGRNRVVVYSDSILPYES